DVEELGDTGREHEVAADRELAAHELHDGLALPVTILQKVSESICGLTRGPPLASSTISRDPPTGAPRSSGPCSATWSRARWLSSEKPGYPARSSPTRRERRSSARSAGDARNGADAPRARRAPGSRSGSPGTRRRRRSAARPRRPPSRAR